MRYTCFGHWLFFFCLRPLVTVVGLCAVEPHSPLIQHQSLSLTNCCMSSRTFLINFPFLFYHFQRDRTEFSWIRNMYIQPVERSDFVHRQKLFATNLCWTIVFFSSLQPLKHSHARFSTYDFRLSNFSSPRKRIHSRIKEKNIYPLRDLNVYFFSFSPHVVTTCKQVTRKYGDITMALFSLLLCCLEVIYILLRCTLRTHRSTIDAKTKPNRAETKTVKFETNQNIWKAPWAVANRHNGRSRIFR